MRFSEKCWSRAKAGAVAWAAVILLPVLVPPPVCAEVWLLRSGEEYYGDLESYSFHTKEVTLRKSDGKPFTFLADELAFGAKSKLIFSRAFAKALPGYRPPVFPLFGALLVALMGLALPLLAGLFASAHVLGVEASTLAHLRAFLKILLLVLVMAVGWLTVSLVLDPGVPVVPDTNADLVLILTSLNCGILFGSLLLSLHYRRSFWKGLAITLLGGVFSTILWASGNLALLYLATRRDLETVVDRLVFEPFRWF